MNKTKKEDTKVATDIATEIADREIESFEGNSKDSNYYTLYYNKESGKSWWFCEASENTWQKYENDDVVKLLQVGGVVGQVEDDDDGDIAESYECFRNLIQERIDESEQ